MDDGAFFVKCGETQQRFSMAPPERALPAVSDLAQNAAKLSSSDAFESYRHGYGTSGF